MNELIRYKTIKLYKRMIEYYLGNTLPLLNEKSFQINLRIIKLFVHEYVLLLL